MIYMFEKVLMFALFYFYLNISKFRTKNRYVSRATIVPPVTTVRGLFSSVSTLGRDGLLYLYREASGNGVGELRPRGCDLYTFRVPHL